MLRAMARLPLVALVGALAASCGGPDRPKPATSPAPTPVAEPTADAPPAPTTAPATTVETRVVVSLSRPSGKSVMTTAPDGSITTTLDVLLNGRGPHYDATLALAADGTIAKFAATGHHTMGTAAAETFRREGDHARWKGNEEAGERDVTGPAFFVPIARPPEVEGMLVRAAIANGGKLPLLPDGELRIERGPELTIQGAGGSRKVVEYTLLGLSLVPVHTWMNPDGTWFGTVSAWWSVVPEGWEPAIEPLIAKQRELDRDRDARLATELAHKPPAAGLAYTHARVLDVDKGKWLKDQTVIVVGDKIQWVGPAKKAKVPQGAEVVDLHGRALMPGMFDMHAHLGDGDGVLDLASGVTTARDVGNDPDVLDDWKRRFDEGTAIGPHVIRFGFIEGRNEKAASSKVTAETVEEAKAAVKFYVDRGYEGVKIYNSVRTELVPVIAAEAHRAGKKVTGHIPVHMLANEAVRAGYDGIEHINMLFLNFFATHETDTRDTTRFTLVGDNAADFDLNGKPARELIQLLKKHKTVIDPTLGAFEDLLVGEQGKVTAGREELVARLPLLAQRDFLIGGLPLGDKRDRYRASFEKLLAMVKKLHDSKVILVLGTDALAGLMFQHEIALFARAGIKPADILRMATIGAARTLGLDRTTGSIKAGKVADLVVVDGDPLKRIGDAARVVSTMRSGVVFDTAALYATVGVRPITAAAAPAPSAK